MSIPAPTVVIFDMDGTTVRHLNARLLHVMEKMDDFAYRCGRLWAWLWRKDRKQKELDEILSAKRKRNPQLIVHRALHKMRRKSVEQIVEPCPHVVEVLDLLQSHSMPMALVSNGLGKGYGHDILKKFDLEEYFSATIFREDIRHSKPNPEPLLLALREMGVSLSKNDVIWYIGDRHKDVTAAVETTKHVPCKVVPIAYGLNAAVAIIDKGLPAENIIMSYEDMAGRLRRLLKPSAQKKDQSEPQPVRLAGSSRR